MSLKKGFILQSKGRHLGKIRRCATRGGITFLILAALRVAQHEPLHFRFASYAYDRSRAGGTSTAGAVPLFTLYANIN